MAQQNRNNYRNDHRNSGRDNRNNNPRPPEAEVKVTSPYNFVPLNKDVYFPSWGALVSHDVPFEDGLSGSFEVEIEAKSPIFIRGTQVNEDKYYDNDGEKTSTEFMHFIDKDGQKKYFIPGSSFRNMIRSIVEILGFGKLNFVNEMDDFSFRDMNNPNLYTLRQQASKLKMGWLQKLDNEITIIDAGDLGDLRVHNREILINQSEINSQLRYKTKLVDKYKLLKDSHYSKFTLADNIDSKSTPKILVLTGQIEGKNREFLFKNPDLLDEEYTISDTVMKNFKKAYDKSESWQFWKQKFEKKQPIPVFFRVDDTERVIDFGLTVLYKMSYKKGILETINRQQPNRESQKPDLAETIFGKTDNDKLKSRIFVSHAFSENAKEGSLQTLILGSPKPTFYPFYIEQKVAADGKLLPNQNYKTFQDGDAKISGRKRYPIHQSFAPQEIKPFNGGQQDTSRVETQFIPLEGGTVFKAKINYHNLKPMELGAVISAITFHGNNDTLNHNLGMAKPYGFGNIKVNLDLNNDFLQHLSSFEMEMNKFIPNWILSPQIKELFAMAKGMSPETGKLKYPDLKNFAKLKNIRDKKALPRFSEFIKP